MQKIITHFAEGFNHFEENFKYYGLHINSAAYIQNNCNGLVISCSTRIQFQIFERP